MEPTNSDQPRYQLRNRATVRKGMQIYMNCGNILLFCEIQQRSKWVNDIHKIKPLFFKTTIHGWSAACGHLSIAQRDPSMAARSIDACANSRSVDGAAPSVDSANRSIARNIHIVSALWAQANCLYAHFYIRNRINNTIRLLKTSTSGSQEWCFKIIQPTITNITTITLYL